MCIPCSVRVFHFKHASITDFRHKNKVKNEVLTKLVTLGSAPAFNKHLIISVNPSEAALSRGVTPCFLKFGSAPA